MQKKQLINDIVVLRLIFIALLLVYHSFAPFCGSWQPLPRGEECSTYFWIARASYSFFLEGFVFISGYLAAYGIVKNTPLGFSYIKKKFRRLIIPSIIFSTIYFFIFYEWEGPLKFLYSIFNGCGHLWFLPMLFWCFVGLYIVIKLKLRPIAVLSVATIILIFHPVIPFRLGEAMQYFLFFYLGYTIQTRQLSDKLTQKVYPAIVLALIFLPCFCFSTDYQFVMWGGGGWIVRRFFCFVSSLTGLLSCFVIVGYFCRKINSLPKVLTTLSGYSFGIYIFQQFILIYLYYYTVLPLYIDYLYVPWIGLIIAFALSYFFSFFLMKYKIGRILIG